MKNKNVVMEITPQMLETLRTELMMKEDELSKMLSETIEKGQTLNDPALAEFAAEVENDELDLLALENLYRAKVKNE